MLTGFISVLSGFVVFTCVFRRSLFAVVLRSMFALYFLPCGIERVSTTLEPITVNCYVVLLLSIVAVE